MAVHFRSHDGLERPSYASRIKYPRQGLNIPHDSRDNPPIGVQGDALSDARLIELVEAWAGLPDGVKDRIAELVASIVGIPRGG